MKIKTYLKEKYPILIILLLIIVALGYNQVQRMEEKTDIVEEEDVIVEGTEEISYYRALDGKEIEEDEEKYPRNVAIMVENNVESWPLVGIDKASIVYEVLAEGRIPRFLTIFPYTEIPEKVGPVRSARTYYLELALPFDAPYMHVGGSPDALSKIPDFGILDADQFFWSSYYWRSRDRYAPHNVYTQGVLVNEMFEDRELSLVSDFEGWQFKDPREISNEDIEEFAQHEDIVVNYTTNTYQSKYVYNPALNQYQRYQAKRPLILQDGSEVWVDNVIVEEHAHEVYDAVGRRNIDIVGEGDAWVFRDGEVIEATWKKGSRGELTRYYDQEGNEILLNRGKTWVNIVEMGTFEYDTSDEEENLDT